MTEVEQEAARICTQMSHSHQEPFCELAYWSASLFLRLQQGEAMSKTYSFMKYPMAPPAPEVQPMKSWEMNLNEIKYRELIEEMRSALEMALECLDDGPVFRQCAEALKHATTAR